MTTNSPDIYRQPIPFLSLAPFLLITFGLTWGILAAYFFFPDTMEGIYGSLTGQHPLFFLAVYAPAIAAFFVVLYYSGSGGLQRFVSRILLWRCSRVWYAFLILGIPLLFYGGAALKGTLFTNPFSTHSFPALLVALGLAVIKGPVEEFGWRGVMLPLLQQKFAPIWAGLILGVIWGIWHLPAFVLSGTPQSAWSFAPFFTGSVAISVLMTPMYNQSRGSILLPALFHFQLINPIWPDAQPHDTALFVAAAVLVVWLNRKTMFTRDAALTEIIPPRDSFTK